MKTATAPFDLLSLAAPFYILVLTLFLLLPSSAFASQVKPTCTLTATTSEKAFSTKTAGTFVIPAGKEVGIAWSSTHADAALLNGAKVGTSGFKSYVPKKTQDYSFTFLNGKKKGRCEVTVKVVSGELDSNATVSLSQKPTISGSAKGVRTLTVALYNDDDEDPVYMSKKIQVKRGEWKAKVTEKLPKDTYRVVVADADTDYAIASGTLAIGKASAAAAKTTIVVELVPLLSGGIVHKGSTVPVSYLQVTNIGKTAAHIHGFEIKQNGNAAPESIIALTASDDIDSFRKTLGGTEGSRIFSENRAWVPADAIIPAGGMRLFTIKASLSTNILTQRGKNLMLDVTGVNGDAALKAAFPIRGTTWTIDF